MKLISVNNNIAQGTAESPQKVNYMKIKEYEAYKSHILNYMTIDDLKANLENHTPEQLIRDGFFDCYYAQILDTLKDVYGDDYNEDIYLDKKGELRIKLGEPYCWKVYLGKMAMAIKKLMKENQHA